jgi:LysM repeat protein
MSRLGGYSTLRWTCYLAVLVTCLLPLKAVTAAGFNAITARGNQPTPADLIAAVNQLRVERGLNPLNVHPILIKTAQMQADALLASGGAVGHRRPNGLSFTDQLILLGYPLAGDLSLGGYRAENFLSAPPFITVANVVHMWLGDAVHTNTMLSPYYEDIGAGIAIDQDGTVFYVIDCAMPTASRTPQAYTPDSGSAGDGSQDGPIQYIQPVVLATARPDGDVIHKVLYGQALWSIAIAYGVKIEQIQRYNNISDTTIYVGQKLLVQKGATQPAPTQAAASNTTAGRSPTPTPSPRSTSTPTAVPTDSLHTSGGGNPPEDPGKYAVPSTTLFVLGITLFSMLVGGLITWLGNRRGD